MKASSISIVFLNFVFGFASFAWSQEKEGKVPGALIVVERQPPVSFLDDSGNPFEDKVEVGSVLAPGNWAIAEKGGKLTLLLSNGTLVTLLSNSKIKVGEFVQQPFEPGDRKVSDLTDEPSSSKVSVDLDFGSLVIKTKKLNKDSSFDIQTEVGTAGIRGTEFQIGFGNSQGMQLDVTESTVAFTPPGGTATPVGQGGGLDFAGSGAVVTRALNPAVAQNIAAVNASATLASNDLSLSVVTDAMNQTAELSSEGGTGDSTSEDGEGEESEGDGEGEGGADGETEGNNDEGGASDSESGATEASGNVEAGDSQPLVESTGSSMIDSLLETDPDAKQTRETGKVSLNAKRMAGLPLTKSQLEKFYTFSDASQNDLLDQPLSDTMRLLDLEGFGQSQAEAFFSYGEETRGLILNLENPALISLLDSDLEESLLRASISKDSIDSGHSENIPEISPDAFLDHELRELGDSLRASGNAYILNEIEILNRGSWTTDWIEVAVVANQLTQDYDFTQGLSSLTVHTSVQALQNPFFDEVSTLYNQLFLDRMDAGMNPKILGGNSILLGTATYDFSEILGDASAILIGAKEYVGLEGSIEVITNSPVDAKLVFASGGAIEIPSGTDLKSVLSDLVISAREDVLLQEVALESAREIAVRSLRDLIINEVTLSASDRVHLRASHNLEIDGLQISQSLPSLIMEATTIRLKNIDFPSATSVQLNSLKGPIDGKYPNFGTGIPLEQQLGRVNFINNVRSGGNLMNDRESFDQHGGNISIGKLP